MIRKIFIFNLFLILLGLASADIIWGEESSVPFYISSGSYFCIDGNYWGVYDIEDNLIRTDSLLDCYNPSGYHRTCCPSPTHTCDISSGICVAEPIYLCGQYEDEESCENANYDIGEKSVEEIVGKTSFCGTQRVYSEDEDCIEYISDCRCEWDNGKCDSVYDSLVICPDGTIPSGECSFSFLEVIDECETEGYLTYITEAVWGGVNDSSILGFEDCADKEDHADCGTPLLKLPGFSVFAIIISLALIFVIYYFRKKIF
ncbi:MAG: hypothetical protein WC494_00340 [Candidatus Pacearchaeota archaeon]